MKKIFSNQFVIVFALILLTTASRLIPHRMNFEPVIAIALFAGAYVSNKKWAFILPLSSLLISDIIIYSANGYEFFTFLNLVVYGSFFLITLMGFKLRENPSFIKVILASLAACVLFYVTTNFAAWAEGACGLYTRDMNGLMASYSAALYPYFTDTIISTLLYSALLFGAVAFVRQRTTVLAGK